MDSATPSLPDKRPIDTLLLPSDKKIRTSSSTAATTTGALDAGFKPTTPPPAPGSSPPADADAARTGYPFEALPTVTISHVGSFAAGSSLSEACRCTLAALPRLHYRVNMWSDAVMLDPGVDPSGDVVKPNLELEASGVLASGRVITRITIINVLSSIDDKDEAEYSVLEQAIKRVVQHSINTLRAITINGAYRGDGRASGVANILGALVPLSRKQQRVAPRLSRVHLVAGATGVAKAGKAIAAGLWPALEVLTFSHCRANAGHFKDLAYGLSLGLAPRLRVLCWDDQSCIRKNPVDDVILAALSSGRCPLIERLSFTGNHFCPENRIEYLRGALRACPLLRQLRMDCSRTPHVQLRDLAWALEAGHAPLLEVLYVRATAPYYRDSDVELEALRRAAASREPPVELEAKIKTRLKG